MTHALRTFLLPLVFRQPLLGFYLALAALLLVVAAGQLKSTAAPDAIDNLVGTPPLLYSDESEFIIDDDKLTEALEEQLAEVAPATLAVSTAVIDTTPPEPEAPNWLEYRVRRGDTMERVLRAINADSDLRDYLLKQKMKTYRRLRIGSTVYFQQDNNGKVHNILYKTSPEYYFTAGQAADGSFWAKENAPETTRTRKKSGGIIESSLFAATDAAGMTDAAASKLIQVLETQIDFHRDVRKGDSFRVIYDVIHDEHGDIINIGEIIAFEYHNKLQSRERLIRGVYYDNGDTSGYYTPEGESLQRAFLPAPLKYRRVSSKFSKRRFHPVLKRWRPHRGVDYAAPSGTPVHATADGIISKVARERGYGRVVMIKHFNIYTTVYAHLRAFKKGIRRGARVRQGDVIGYVGQSGLATGPHLHYEFRVHNKHKDPLSTVIPKQLPPLKGKVLTAFQQHSSPLFSQLDNIKTATAIQ